MVKIEDVLSLKRAYVKYMDLKENCHAFGCENTEIHVVILNRNSLWKMHFIWAQK